MDNFIRPKVVISKCIEFEPCRYNGLIISSKVVRQFQQAIDFVAICPEVEIGLPIPRQAVRLVKADNAIKLLSSMDGTDHTEKMEEFCRSFLAKEPNVDGFILKSKSPSCGIKNVKLYHNVGRVPALNKKNNGLFGNAVLEAYPNLPIEDEGRLMNLQIRQYFLTKLFTLAEFNSIDRTINSLVRFHSKHKYLFMTYNQSQLKIAGKIVANNNRDHISKIFEDYQQVLYQIFKNRPRISTNINVLMHIFGYFSKHLSSNEKAYFIELLEQYRTNKIPLIVLTTLLKNYILRFDEKYLKMQSYFAPFPVNLMHTEDSGKGRKL